MEITSPTGSSPVPPVGSMPAASDTPFEIHGIKLGLPRWATYCVALILSLGAVIPVVSQVLYPLIQTRLAPDKTQKGFTEYQRHFGEVARNTQTILDSPDLGSISVSYYTSDGCLLLKRKGPGSNQAEILHWIESKPITLEAPPGQLEDKRGSLRESPPPPSQPAFGATYQLASFNPAAAAPPATERAAVGCGNSHSGQFQTWNGQKNGCWVEVWRRWPDGCEHYQWYNTCNGYWDNHPDGTPRVSWKNCVH